MAHGSPTMTASLQNSSYSRSAAKASARAIALSILLEVETQESYASDLLYAHLRDETDAREAAFATELVMGTLRWQAELDFFIERYTKRRTSALDSEVLVALRMGIYQLRHLTRVPIRAAVNESVELVRRARKTSATSLVNAALRRAAGETHEAIENLLPSGMSTSETLAIRHSHPVWMVERWLQRFGKERTIRLLEWNNRPPNQACAILAPERRDEMIDSLRRSGMTMGPGHLLREAIIAERGNTAGTEGFQNGWIAIQDEASQMIPLLLGVQPGNSVLDLCAAPGGKTMKLAQHAGERGFVVACDIHEARIRAMRKRFNAANVKDVFLIALDGTRKLPFSAQFDRILVDAPCSGTGTLARNPEIRWRLPSQKLPELQECQTALLSSALACLAPAGKLLYSTCSLEPEENEAVIEEVLREAREFCIEPIRPPQSLLAAGVRAENLTDAGGLCRTFPPEQRTDGFFAALLRRR